MPKSTKRKNPGVGIDFKRAKYKVGKSLPKAQNETDVSFKSRSITLPSQGITQNRGAAVTSRNLTLKEVLGQCVHYSDKVRREALVGLLELQQHHPEVCNSNLSTIMDRLAERLGDGSAPVRSAAKALLVQGILPAHSPASLGAFLPLLLVHLRVALTSAAQAVRLDALEVLESLTQKMPQQILSHHAAQVLELYVEALEAVQAPQGAELHMHKALMQVLMRLHKFLNLLWQAEQGASTGLVLGAQGSLEGARSPWGFSCQPYPARQHALFSSAWTLLQQLAGPFGAPRALVTHVGLDPLPVAISQLPGSAASKHAVERTKGGKQGGPPAPAAGPRDAVGDPLGAPLAAATSRASKRLLACWSRCTPAALASEEAELPALQAMLAVVQAADTLRCLATTWLGSWEAGAVTHQRTHDGALGYVASAYWCAVRCTRTGAEGGTGNHPARVYQPEPAPIFCSSIHEVLAVRVTAVGAQAVNLEQWRSHLGKWVPVSVSPSVTGAVQQALGRFNKSAKHLLA